MGVSLSVVHPLHDLQHRPNTAFLIFCIFMQCTQLCPSGKERCPSGASSSSVCQDCPEGSYLPPGNSTCVLCPEGTYQGKPLMPRIRLKNIEDLRSSYSISLGIKPTTIFFFILWRWHADSKGQTACNLCPSSSMLVSHSCLTSCFEPLGLLL